LTQEEFEFLEMIIELTTNGEIQARVKQLNNGDFDSDLKLALNRARRIRRWVARNNPNEELRQTELVRAAKGFDHFAYTDLSNDVRFHKINAFVDRLGKAYFVVDLAIDEIEVYVDAVKKRYVAKGGVDKEASAKKTKTLPAEIPPVAAKTAPAAEPIVAPVTKSIVAPVTKSIVAPVTKSIVAPVTKSIVAPVAEPIVASHKPSRAHKSFSSVLRYFVTSPDDVVRIIQDLSGTIEMAGTTEYQAGEILGALKDHFYLDRENGSKLLIKISGNEPINWFGPTDSIEQAVVKTITEKKTSRDFESLRRTFEGALHRQDVR